MIDVFLIFTAVGTLPYFICGCVLIEKDNSLWLSLYPLIPALEQWVQGFFVSVVMSGLGLAAVKLGVATEIALVTLLLFGFQ